mmetsp:Transcript_95835/g.256128  ORF Transcript_95835/g.256128 Transcript_95835/m.256128 type:complete len:202 (-) Transcript_95835:35-640(-)
MPPSFIAGSSRRPSTTGYLVRGSTCRRGTRWMPRVEGVSSPGTRPPIRTPRPSSSSSRNTTCTCSPTSSPGSWWTTPSTAPCGRPGGCSAGRTARWSWSCSGWVALALVAWGAILILPRRRGTSGGSPKSRSSWWPTGPPASGTTTTNSRPATSPPPPGASATPSPPGPAGPCSPWLWPGPPGRRSAGRRGPVAPAPGRWS